jgi:DNA-directed RNA polymerase subunit E'
MFYRTQLKDTVRVPPNLFALDKKEAIVKQLKEKYEAYIAKDLGIVIDVLDVHDVSEGILIQGDGAAFYQTTFDVLTFRIELQEVFAGKVLDITDFGAFVTLGPIEGMIHVSQTMDDFVSFSKDKTLVGKESGRALKVGDVCQSRVIAVSYKDAMSPKFGLTMRQPGLGKLDWLTEEKKPSKKAKAEE